MDTSSGYIKMCEKATEIQALRHDSITGDGYNYRSGDFYAAKNRWLPTELHIRILGSVLSRPFPYCQCFCRPFIFLPRQDQLQEMITEKLPTQLSYDFYRWQTNQFWSSGFLDNPFLSMEQLWLAFVMDTKYGKRWDGQDWIGQKGKMAA